MKQTKVSKFKFREFLWDNYIESRKESLCSIQFSWCSSVCREYLQKDLHRILWLLSRYMSSVKAFNLPTVSNPIIILRMTWIHPVMTEDWITHMLWFFILLKSRPSILPLLSGPPSTSQSRAALFICKNCCQTLPALP